MEFIDYIEKIEILSTGILFGLGLSLFIGLMSWAIASAFRLVIKIIR